MRPYRRRTDSTWTLKSLLAALVSALATPFTPTLPITLLCVDVNRHAYQTERSERLASFRRPTTFDTIISASNIATRVALSRVRLARAPACCHPSIYSAPPFRFARMSSSSKSAQASSSSSVPSTSAPISRSRVPTIPKLLYGTAWKKDYTSDLVILALTHGFRGIDTAGQRKHYREDHVGSALETAAQEMHLKREDVWIQTKFTPRSGQDWNHPELVPYRQDEDVAIQVKKSFAASLRNLHPWLKFEDLKEVSKKIESGTEDEEVPYSDKGGEAYIDSYVLHSPLTTLERTLKVWATMELFVHLGLVRQIGLSNTYDPEIFQAISKTTTIRPSILQNRWHYSTGHDVALLSLLSPTLSPNDHGKGGEGVVYQPFWSLTGNPNLLSSVEVQDIAIKKGWTPQQVVYSFLARGMNIPGLNITVLSGTSNEEHMIQAVEAVKAAQDKDQWSEDDLDRIRRVVYGE